MQRNFTLEFWQDEGWYVGRLRDVPGIFSQGETLVALEANIREVYQLMKDEIPNAPMELISTKEIGVEV